VIYLASPYSHPHAVVREHRFLAACQVAAKFIASGHATFSPIVHGHPLVDHGLPTDWWFWERVNREHIARCDEVVVLTLNGWQDSVGVAAEIRIAGELGKPVRYLATNAAVPPTVATVAKEAGR
jgi:hypothetical protein